MGAFFLACLQIKLKLKFELGGFIAYFCILISGSSGRVARQRSAKPFTAVRIRSRPHHKKARFSIKPCLSFLFTFLEFHPRASGTLKLPLRKSKASFKGTIACLLDLDHRAFFLGIRFLLGLSEL